MHKLRRHGESGQSNIGAVNAEANAAQKNDAERKELNSPNDEVLTCRYCDYTTTTKKNLYSHKSRHHRLADDQALKCRQCSFSSDNSRALNDHISNVHKRTDYIQEDNGSFKCIQCEYSTAVKNNMHTHVQKHRKGKQAIEAAPIDIPSQANMMPGAPSDMSQSVSAYDAHIDSEGKSCRSCKSSFSQRSDLRKHVRRFHLDGKYPCDGCSYLAEDVEDLKKHSRNNIHDIKTLRADTSALPITTGPNAKRITEQPEQTSEKATTEDRSQSAYKYIKSDGKSQTSETERKSQSVSAYKKHIKMEGKSLSCGVCGTHFAGSRQIRQHVRNMHLGGKYPCDDCSHLAANMDDLDHHACYVHGKKTRGRAARSTSTPRPNAKKNSLDTIIDVDSNNNNNNEDDDDEDDDDVIDITGDQLDVSSDEDIAVNERSSRSKIPTRSSAKLKKSLTNEQAAASKDTDHKVTRNITDTNDTNDITDGESIAEDAVVERSITRRQTRRSASQQNNHSETSEANDDDVVVVDESHSNSTPRSKVNILDDSRISEVDVDFAFLEQTPSRILRDDAEAPPYRSVYSNIIEIKGDSFSCR
jgi:hypothetical protein